MQVNHNYIKTITCELSPVTVYARKPAKPASTVEKVSFVAQKTFQFLNQAPASPVVTYFAIALTISTLTVLWTPLGLSGLAAGILLVPVIKEVAARAGVITGNLVFNLVTAQFDKTETFTQKMGKSIETETSPLLVRAGGSIIGSAVFAVFTNMFVPAPLSEPSKLILKTIVSGPVKQLSRTGLQVIYTKLVPGCKTEAGSYLTLSGLVHDLFQDSGESAAVHLGGRISKRLTGKAAEVALRTAGMFVGSNAYNAPKNWIARSFSKKEGTPRKFDVVK